MKILAVGNMYPPQHLGGYEMVWQSAMLHLAERGDDVRVLTSDYRAAEVMDPEAEIYRELSWYWRDHEFPRLSLVDRLRLERRNRRILGRHLDETRPDVVTWWAMGGMSLAMIEQVRRRRLPAVGFVHDDWMVYGPHVDQWHRAGAQVGAFRGPVSWATGIATRVRLSEAASWVFVSQATLNHSTAAVGTLRSTSVVHSGIRLESFSPSDPKPWQWDLLYVGRIDDRKGVHVAVEALTHIPKAANLTIVGGGDETYLGHLRSLAKSCGVDDRVSFVAPEDADVPESYRHADAVLFPVLWEEPWGLVPLEAMAVGIPVVATGAGGSGEYLRDGENCLLAEKGNAVALALRIRRLAKDPDLRNRLRRGGLETAPLHTEDGFNRAVADAIDSAHSEAVNR